MNLELHNQPFFVVGADRSGTTMLRLMLNEHPRLRIPHESWFIPKLMNNLPLQSPLTQEEVRLAFDLIVSSSRWQKNWEIPTQKLWDILSKLKQPLLSELIDAVFRGCINPENKPRWGDKTPTYIKQISRLHQVFPQAKFIHLIRDGRDVCLSLRKTGWHGGLTSSSAKYWRRSVATGIEQGRTLGSDLYCEVKYEDLVLNSATTLKHLCTFLGEEYDTSMLGFYQHSAAELPQWEKQKQVHNKTMRPPQASDVHRWKREMTLLDVAIFEAEAGEVMDQVGQTRKFQGPLRLIPRLLGGRLGTKLEWR